MPAPLPTDRFTKIGLFPDYRPAWADAPAKATKAKTLTRRKAPPRRRAK